MGQAYKSTDFVGGMMSRSSPKSGLSGDFAKWQQGTLGGNIGK